MNIKHQEEKGRFVQFPLYLIYGCPELTRDDRFVLLAIMGEYWTSGPHKLSYRDIASLSGVPISLLSSIKGKDGKPDKEGIIDRLVRLGFIKVTLGKELKAGRATGNAQTFVEIEYKKIWQDNVLYCENRKHSDNKEVEFQPVSYTNRLKKSQPVRIENEPVSYTNRLDPNTNGSVSYTNKPVRDASSKATPNITDIKTIKDKEDSVAFLPDDKERTPSLLVSHSDYDANIRTNDAISPIVSETTTEDDIDVLTTGKDQQGLMDTTPSEEQQQEPSQETLFSDITPVPSDEKPKESTKGKGRNKKNTVQSSDPEKVEKPQMPPEDLPWCTNKCKLMFDAWRGSKLISMRKIQEASRCAKGLAEQYTEDEIVKVYKTMSESEYWKQQGGVDIFDVANNIHKEIRKVRLHLVKSGTKPQATLEQTKPTITAKVDEEISDRNLQIMLAKVAAMQGAK